MPPAVHKMPSQREKVKVKVRERKEVERKVKERHQAKVTTKPEKGRMRGRTKVVPKEPRVVPRTRATRVLHKRVFVCFGPKIFADEVRIAHIDMKDRQCRQLRQLRLLLHHLRPSLPLRRPRRQQLLRPWLRLLPTMFLELLRAASVAAASSHNSFDVHWAFDSGAGEDLASIGSFNNLGVLTDVVNSFCVVTDSPLHFETGGGTKSSTNTVGFIGDKAGEGMVYMLKNCPYVRSLGKLIQKGFSFFFGDPTMNRHLCHKTFHSMCHVTRISVMY